MKRPPLALLNGVFGVIKPYGITATKTCNQIRDDLVRGIKAHLMYSHLILLMHDAFVIMNHHTITMMFISLSVCLSVRL